MEYPKTSLNTVKRGAKKASYDKKEVHAILDAADVCFVAFQHGGRACVQPINFGRKGGKLYLHGSHQNRMTNALIESGEVCLSVMLLDAMKLTRSAFHHSVNYRSAVVFGSVRELTAKQDKLTGLEALINHFVPGRWEHCRKPNDKELKATRIIEITIESASAKIAVGPPKDNAEDLQLDHWAGTIPVKTVCGFPVGDERLKPGTGIPEHVMDFYGKHKDGF